MRVCVPFSSAASTGNCCVISPTPQNTLLLIIVITTTTTTTALSYVYMYLCVGLCSVHRSQKVLDLLELELDGGVGWSARSRAVHAQPRSHLFRLVFLFTVFYSVYMYHFFFNLIIW